MSHLKLALSISALAMVWVLPAAAEGGAADVPQNGCAPTVEQKITDLNVNRVDIDRIVFSPVYENNDDNNTRLRGIDAWVRFKDAKGSLIVDMMRDCSVRQVYTRGAVTLPGVKSF